MYTTLYCGICTLNCCALQEGHYAFTNDLWIDLEKFKVWAVRYNHSEYLDIHAVSTVYKLCATVLNHHSPWQIWELSAQSQCCASCSLTSRHGRPLIDDETPLCTLPVVLCLQKCEIWIKQNGNVYNSVNKEQRTKKIIDHIIMILFWIGIYLFYKFHYTPNVFF